MLRPARRQGARRPRWICVRSPLMAPACAGVVLLAMVLLLQTVRAPAAALGSGCAGDCNGDGQVTVDELVTLARIALGVASLSACHPGDTNSDGRITVDEIVAAVNAAGNQCPATQTPTPSNTATATPSPTLSPHVLMGDDVVGGAARVAVSTMQAIQIMDFGFVGATALSAQPGLGAGAGTFCSGGGTKDVSCSPSGGSSTQTIVYTACSEIDPSSGQMVTRNGTLVQMVVGTDICSSGQIPPAADVTLHFTNFTETLPLGGGHTFTLTIPDLTLARDTNGSRLTADGTQTVDNDATGEHFTQSFLAFVVTEAVQGDGSVMVTEDGVMTVDCLGDLEFITNQAVPLLFDAFGACPFGGELAVRRPVLGPGIVTAAADDVRVAATASVQTPPSGFRQFVLRSSNGTSYQVLQNSGSDLSLGAESIRVTTVVGSVGGSVGSCDNSAGSGSNPEAVAAAAAGQAVPPVQVFKSARIADATVPCFNQNANNGDGGVCIGPAIAPGMEPPTGCTADCQCLGANCSAFTITNGTVITTASADVSAASLVNVPALDAPCSGFAGRSTYSFSNLTPTTETMQCTDAPADGFSLPSATSLFAGGTTGTTVIFAYNTPLISLFNAGSAGFPIDVDGTNQVGCTGMNQVLNLGHSNLGSVPAPQIAFTANRGLAFDFNGDRVVDKAVSTCQIPALAKCVAPPVPTPTPAPPPACPQTMLAPPLPLSIAGTTTSRANALGGASCGDGGNRSPETTFDFTATQFGFYTFSTSADFDTLLYVRKDSCDGAELACNDDAGPNTGTSAATVQLFNGDHVVIVVDGYGGASGNFTLDINRSDTQPPTPTPNASPPFAGLPDLQVVAVTAPATGVIGEQIIVSATVANRGLADAGAFQVSFVLAKAMDLNQVVATAGFSCSFSRLGTNQNDNTATCGDPSPIGVPLMPPGDYFVGAIVDATNQVIESNEANNVGWSANPVAINAIGVDFQQQLFRALDGTVYQVLRGVPISFPKAESYVLSTLAGSTGSITACQSQQPLSAVVGVPTVVGQGLYTGTTLYTRRFDGVTQAEFRDSNAGVLTLDNGAGGFNVCRVATDCPAGTSEPLITALSVFPTGTEDLCLAAGIDAVEASCSNFLLDTIGFGHPASCSFPGPPPQPCVPRCAAPPSTSGPSSGGLSLTATQAFVIVYTPPAASSFTLGVAGFGINAGGGVVSAFQNTQTAPGVPTGCCTFAGPSCMQVTQLQCQALGGTFFDVATCVPDVGFCVA